MGTSRSQVTGRRGRRREVVLPACALLLVAVLALVVPGVANAADDVPSAQPRPAADDLPERRQAALEFALNDESFAGTWWDSATARLVFAFSDQDIGRDNEVAQRVDRSLRADLAFEQVSHSLDELRSDRDRMLAARHSGVEGVGVDPVNNGLVVVTSNEAASRGALGDRGADAPRLTFLVGNNADDTCLTRLNCGGTSQRRGGVSLDRSGFVCTSGLNVLKGSTRYATTAGHCWWGTNSGTVTSGSQSFGSLNSSNALYSGSWCDCRLITPTSGVTVADAVYFSNATPYSTFSSKRTYSAVGDSVRILGRSTQSTGTVQYVEYSYVGETCGCTVYGGTLAGYSSVGGDSGGAVTSTGGTVAVGIHSGRSAGLGRFTEVVNIEAYLGVTVQT